MLPKHHAIFGFLITIALIYLLKLSLLAGIIIFLASILIDVDHYLYYVFKKKDLSLSRAYKYFLKLRQDRRKNKIFRPMFLLFHGVESFIILGILALLGFKLFLWILIGFIIHLFLDLMDLIAYKEPLYSKLSQLCVLYVLTYQ